MGSNNFIEKSKLTYQIKYNVDFYGQSNEFKQLFNNKEWVKMIQNKINITKKKNKSFNTSKPEDDYYRILCNKYNENDVVRQYKTDLYPFNCDFYIKSEDTYIEYNGHWTHGTEPYNPNKKEHQLIIEKWKSKSSSFYIQAIKNWTIRDPLKRQTAKDNNLNFIEIWPSKI